MLHRHQHLFHRHLRGSRAGDPIKKFYIASLLHDLGIQMLSIFVLFYLYQLGWPVPIIISYVLAYTLMQPAFQYLGTALVLKLSVQKAVLISNILRIAFAVALFSLEGPSTASYVLLALTVVLDAASFWIYYLAWDIHFSDLQAKTDSGKQISVAFAVTALAGFLAPLAGGLLAQSLGFKASLVIAGILLLFSITPLLLIKRRNLAAAKLPMKEVMSFSRSLQLFRRTPKAGLAALIVATMIFRLVLPLWLFYLAVVIFTDGAYSGLGIVAAASTVTAVLVSLLTGRLVDRGRYKTALRSGAWGELLLGGLRFFVTGVPLAVAHNLLWQQSYSHNIVAFEWYYEQERRQADRLAFFQMCSYCQAAAHGFLLVIIMASLLVFSASQFEVLRFACIALALFAPLILGFRLSRR